jgi:hypothetical protein
MKLDARAELHDLLEATAVRGARFIDGLDSQHVSSTASLAESREGFPARLPEAGLEPLQVIARLVSKIEPGLLATPGGRFFGWVIGGTLPAALATDADLSVGPAAIVASSPAAAAIEEVCGSVCSWRTSEADVSRSLAAVHAAVQATA